MSVDQHCEADTEGDMQLPVFWMRRGALLCQNGLQSAEVGLGRSCVSLERTL